MYTHTHRYVDALHNLGVALMLQKLRIEAFPYFLRVLAYKPDYPGATQNVEGLRREFGL